MMTGFGTKATAISFCWGPAISTQSQQINFSGNISKPPANCHRQKNMSISGQTIKADLIEKIRASMPRGGVIHEYRQRRQQRIAVSRDESILLKSKKWLFLAQFFHR